VNRPALQGVNPSCSNCSAIKMSQCLKPFVPDGLFGRLALILVDKQDLILPFR
jgi:hypothetical protein